MSEGQQPSVGRVVHYVPLSDVPNVFSEPDGDLIPPPGHWPAMITAVPSQGFAHVWLTVFPPGEPPRAFARPVRHSEDTSFEGTWHWPERVG